MPWRGIHSLPGPMCQRHYGSSIAGVLRRPGAVKESAGSVTLATFKFLGIGVGVSLKYDAASNAEWTMRNGASSGDAGDVYTGLDRFGRLVETIWQAGSTELVHTTYGRNRVGGVTWQRNVLAHAMTGSPLPPERLQQDNFYWYDGLQQNYQHQRGDLAGTAPNYTGITNLQQTEIRSFDEPTGAPRRKTDQARRVGPKGEAKPNQTGNWLSNYTSSPTLTQSRSHNKANEISTISGLTAPTFDGVGNMKTMPKPGAWSTTCTLTWDAWNRLITCTDGTTTTTNRYDALTRRIRKSITGGEVRDYYYDKQWRSIEERLSGTFSGPDKTRHVWSPFDRWNLIRRQRETAGTLTDTHYCLKDYLDPAALITPAAAVVERFSYDAFGPVRFMNAAFVTQSSSSYAWTFLFHGEFIDPESGLYNYGYRFYHPQLSRWLSRDPLENSNIFSNLYFFVENEAIKFLDLFGLKTKKAPKKEKSPKKEKAQKKESEPQPKYRITVVGPRGFCPCPQKSYSNKSINEVVSISSELSHCCLKIEGTGKLKIDDDGTGSSHNDKNHQRTTSLRGLNADNDSYAVAPTAFAFLNGGPLSPGSSATVTVGDRTIETVIGDFGPPENAGEISIKAAHDLGIPTKDKPYPLGPVPVGPERDVDVAWWTCP